MAKPLSPEVLALIPDGIENLVLRCVVCGGALPSSRRAYGDHAGVCHKVRVLYRRYMLSLTRCLGCSHPSTPAEREDFKLWRIARGDLRGRGSKHGGRTKLPVPSTEYPEKTLDKSADVFETPDVALCDIKSDEKTQGVV